MNLCFEWVNKKMEPMSLSGCFERLGKKKYR